MNRPETWRRSISSSKLKYLLGNSKSFKRMGSVTTSLFSRGVRRMRILLNSVRMSSVLLRRLRRYHTHRSYFIGLAYIIGSVAHCECQGLYYQVLIKETGMSLRKDILVCMSQAAQD